MSEHAISCEEHLTRRDGSAVSPGHLEDVRRDARRDSASMMAEPDGPLLVGLHDDTSSHELPPQ